MVEPAEPRLDGAAADGGSQEVLALEKLLHGAAVEAHLATSDLTVYLLCACRVIAKLREVAPDLVRAAEEEVTGRMIDL